MIKTLGERVHVALDFPASNELIISPSYTIRLSVSEQVETVQVSIDGQHWQPCRFSDGYYWYDWSGYMSGRHELQTQAWLRDGTVEKSAVHVVRVELSAARR